jgi:hypothetical protein
MLFSRKSRKVDSEEIARMKPERLIPVPEREFRLPGIKKRFANLAQYAGRSEKGRLRALKNLGRQARKTMSTLPVKAPIVPANIPQPKVPTAIPDIPHAELMRGKAIRSVLSKEEFDLYTEEWVSWFKDHPEYDRKEDLVDIDRICMEVVVQFRINTMTLNFPSRDYSMPLNQSVHRQQRARENLEARRVDRNRPKGPKSMTVNNFGGAPISVVVGQITMQERESRAREQQQATLDFLEMPPSLPNAVASGHEDIIDVEAVVKE